MSIIVPALCVGWAFIVCYAALASHVTRRSSRFSSGRGDSNAATVSARSAAGKFLKQRRAVMLPSENFGTGLLGGPVTSSGFSLHETPAALRFQDCPQAASVKCLYPDCLTIGCPIQRRRERERERTIKRQIAIGIRTRLFPGPQPSTLNHP